MKPSFRLLLALTVLTFGASLFAGKPLVHCEHLRFLTADGELSAVVSALAFSIAQEDDGSFTADAQIDAETLPQNPVTEQELEGRIVDSFRTELAPYHLGLEAAVRAFIYEIDFRAGALDSAAIIRFFDAEKKNILNLVLFGPVIGVCDEPHQTT